MANITLLPSAKVPLVYEGENTMTTEWYRFFWNIYGFTGTGVIPVDKGGTGLDTIGEHQLIIGNANNVFEPALLSSASILITYVPGYVNLELGISGVTAGAYGSASTVGQFTVNQYGILTAASNVSIGIDASQIISGTIASARISGSYTGITGVGTLTVGTWNASTIDVAYGGTGQTTYTNGQLLIGNTTGNTLTKATLTAGSGVTITNGAGTITISATSSGGTVTSVAATGGTGISVTGSPITTSGTLNITNTAPDQTVVLTAGTGISTSGTYPNFTITNTSPSSGGTVTSVTGTSPVVSSGGNTPAISMPAATTSVSGYLTSTDWTTFNNKQTALVSGTNIKTVGGTSLLGSGDVNTIGNSTNAVNVGITDDTTTNSDYYVTFVAASSGNTPIKTSASKLKYHPSTGALTASIIYIAP